MSHICDYFHTWMYIFTCEWHLFIVDCLFPLEDSNLPMWKQNKTHEITCLFTSEVHISQHCHMQLNHFHKINVKCASQLVVIVFNFGTVPWKTWIFDAVFDTTGKNWHKSTKTSHFLTGMFICNELFSDVHSRFHMWKQFCDCNTTTQTIERNVKQQIWECFI